MEEEWNKIQTQSKRWQGEKPIVKSVTEEKKNADTTENK
jgi:hypothetical protein